MISGKVALVLQGGGSRGVFSAGVTDAFFDANLEFPYVIGTSSGCLVSFNVISNDRERAKTLFFKTMPDKRFASFGNLFKTGSFFNFNFLFYEAPKVITPFNWDTFNNTKVKFLCGCTEVESGKPCYFEKSHPEFFAAAAGSSTLPFMGKPVKVENAHYMDGGTTCPIPFRKPLEDGYEKMVVILTRPRSYRKRKMKWYYRLLHRLFYFTKPNYLKALLNGPELYNAEMDALFELEKQGRAFLIFCPEGETVGRTEKDLGKLEPFYQMGYRVGKEVVEPLRQFLGINEK